MNANEIKDILVRKGYNERHANLVAQDLVKIDPHLVEPLNNWLVAGIETEIKYRGVSLKSLMERVKLKYPAALLTIDWVYKEPDLALSVLKFQ